MVGPRYLTNEEVQFRAQPDHGTLYKSSYTTAWGGSISSTNKYCLSGQKAPRTRTWSPFEVTPSNSKSLFVGTHYDLVTDKDLHATDRTFQQKLKCSLLLDDKVVYHNSPDNTQIDQLLT